MEMIEIIIMSINTFIQKKVMVLINIAIGTFYMFIFFLVLSIILYPGTTFLDHSTIGYDMTKNFLSDLGRTVTYLGNPNFYSSISFIFAITMVFIGLFTYFLAFPFIVNKGNISYRFSQLGSLFGIICAFSFLGIALTPDNYYHNWHMIFVHLGFRMFLLVMIFHSMAIGFNNLSISKKPIFVYFIFGLVLAWYIYLLNWGPALDEPDGLAINVISQKITVIGLSLTIFIQALMMRKYIRSLSVK